MSHPRTRLYLSSILFFGLLVAVPAQEPGGGEAVPEPPPAVPIGEGPKSPQELILELRKRIKTYAATKKQADLVYAGKLFDLSDIPSTDQDQIGRIAVRDLHSIDSRVPDMAWRTPRASDTHSPYTIDTGHGEIELVRGADTVWRFSRSTLEDVTAMSVKVGDLPLRRGAITIPLASSVYTYVRDRVPLAWRQRNFLLGHWQWIGLLALIFGGLLMHGITTKLIRSIENVILARSGVGHDLVQQSMARALGQLVMAMIWLWGVQFLLLPATMHVVLMTVARMVMMLATVWAVWRFVDLFTGVWQIRAGRTHTKLDDQLVPLVRRSLKIFVAIAGALWIASTLDMDVGTLLATLGLGGFAFALAAKDTVSNLFGSVTILMDRPFQIGDWIRTGDVEGTVETVGFRSVRVRTFYNSVITLPNSQLITASVDNLGVRQYRRVKEMIGVTYATPTVKLQAFIEGIRELIRQHPYTRKDYYHVYLNKLGASSLDILLYAFLRCPDWSTELREKERLLLDILRLAEELGIQIAFPTQQLRLVQEEPERHPELPADPEAAAAQGRALADRIVERYTGSDIPPPVVISAKAGQDDGDG